MDQAKSKSRRVDCVHVGPGETPLALTGRRAVTLSLNQPSELLRRKNSPKSLNVSSTRTELTNFVLETAQQASELARQTSTLVNVASKGPKYPDSPIAGRMKIAADLIKSGCGARVYFTSQGSYDHHSNQMIYHGELLGQLSDAVYTFWQDLSAAGLAERVALVVFSEFGRRVAENGSFGTDHGTAGPIFVMGPEVRGGIVGKTPSLTDLQDGNLKWSTDFRQVYSTLLEKWLGVKSKEVLGKQFKPLKLFRNHS